MTKRSTDFLNDPAVQRLHDRTKRRLAQFGYNVMHRRKGQFWLVYNRPMTLTEIDEFTYGGLLAAGYSFFSR
jgi:hypothetical protein